jgi:hypothetical protein
VKCQNTESFSIALTFVGNPDHQSYLKLQQKFTRASDTYCFDLPEEMERTYTFSFPRESSVGAKNMHSSSG